VTTLRKFAEAVISVPTDMRTLNVTWSKIECVLRSDILPLGSPHIWDISDNFLLEYFVRAAVCDRCVH
jgi:hypothetical protein